MKENVAKDNQLWLKSLNKESKAGVNECCSDFPAVLKDALSVCNSFGHDQPHNYMHWVNVWTQQRRAEEALGSARGSFSFTVFTLGVLFLHISSSVFLVFIEPHFSLSLALLPVTLRSDLQGSKLSTEQLSTKIILNPIFYPFEAAICLFSWLGTWASKCTALTVELNNLGSPGWGIRRQWQEKPLENCLKIK